MKVDSTRKKSHSQMLSALKLLSTYVKAEELEDEVKEAEVLSTQRT